MGEWDILDSVMNTKKGSLTGSGVGETDWMTTLFGNKEQAGAIPAGVGALSGIMQGWLGYENLQVAQDSVALQKKAFEQNMAMSNMEAGLKLDAMKRGLAKHGVSSEVVNNYAQKYK